MSLKEYVKIGAGGVLASMGALGVLIPFISNPKSESLENLISTGCAAGVSALLAIAGLNLIYSGKYALEEETTRYIRELSGKPLEETSVFERMYSKLGRENYPKQKENSTDK